MTNVEALKEVYLALGGSEENFNATTNDEAIALIATVASGGSGGGGSDDLFFVHFADDMGHTPDKTFAETISASVDGKIISGIANGALYFQRYKSYEDDEEIELYQVPVVRKDSSDTSDKDFTIISTVITWNINGTVSIGGTDLHITGN